MLSPNTLMNMKSPTEPGRVGDVAAVDMVGTPAFWAIWPAAVHGSASDVQMRNLTPFEIRSWATTALCAASDRLSWRVRVIGHLPAMPPLALISLIASSTPLDAGTSEYARPPVWDES